jgi:hypothetical protein
MRSFGVWIGVQCVICLLGADSVTAQLKVGPQTPSHWVRMQPGPDGQPDLFSGAWNSVADLSVMPAPPESISSLKVALVPTMIGSIVPGGKQVESCRQWGLVVQDPSSAERRAVFIIGDAREPRSFRWERLEGNLGLRLTFEAADCLTYEMVAAHKSPAVHGYQLDVRPDTITLRLERD